MGRGEQLVVIVALLFTEDASPPGGTSLALSEAAGDPSSKKMGHLRLTLLQGTRRQFSSRHKRVIFLHKFTLLNIF